MVHRYRDIDQLTTCYPQIFFFISERQKIHSIYQSFFFLSEKSHASVRALKHNRMPLRHRFTIVSKCGVVEFLNQCSWCHSISYLDANGCCSLFDFMVNYGPFKSSYLSRVISSKVNEIMELFSTSQRESQRRNIACHPLLYRCLHVKCSDKLHALVPPGFKLQRQDETCYVYYIEPNSFHSYFFGRDVSSTRSNSFHGLLLGRTNLPRNSFTDHYRFNLFKSRVNRYIPHIST